MIDHKSLLLGPILLACACASCAEAPPPAPAVIAPAKAPPLPPQKSAPAAEGRNEPDPAVVARARELVDRGERLYRTGDYEQAELALKEAVTMHPFLADANLLLGKIFLIRGSATRDLSLIRSARLMFEMARAIDPSLREVQVLLSLFDAPAPE